MIDQSKIRFMHKTFAELLISQTFRLLIIADFHVKWIVLELFKKKKKREKTVFYVLVGKVFSEKVFVGKFQIRFHLPQNIKFPNIKTPPKLPLFCPFS